MKTSLADSGIAAVPIAGAGPAQLERCRKRSAWSDWSEGRRRAPILVEIKVDAEIGIAAARVGDFHDDPADRLIVATASLAGATLLTAAQKILEWTGCLRRQDARE